MEPIIKDDHKRLSRPFCLVEKAATVVLWSAAIGVFF